NLPQRIADFAYSCVSANSIDDEWRGVRGRDTPIRLSPRLLGGGSLQRVETVLHFVSGTAISKKFQFGRLLPRDALIDIKSMRRLFFDCGERGGLVVGVGVQRLRSPPSCRQSLQGHTRNVVHRLLRRQRDARSLRMEAHQPSALVLCAKALFYYLSPNFARCAVLCDL